MSEFLYTSRDFESPDAFLAALDRMEPAHVNRSGYNQKFFQAVTNQGRFESDAWFDLAFDIGEKQSLHSFLERLSEWQTRSESGKTFLPDIVGDASRSNAWVADALQAHALSIVPIVPEKSPEHTFEFSLR